MNARTRTAPGTGGRARPCEPAAAAATAAAAAAAAAATAAATAQWCVGTVREVDGDALGVQLGDARLQASRAVGCLLEPAVDDLVACLRVGQACWVLSVLQRSTEHAGVIRLSRDARIDLAHGTLAMHAPRLELHGRQLQVSAGECRLAADSAEVVAGHLRVIGSVFKVVGSILSTVMDRVNHYSRSHLRTTDGIDRVAATHVECEATQLLRLTGEHALINGEKLVKARGGQIHIG
ncbi:MAG: DUF3540 domain-containing protein [Comamonadaceae bacterium]|nr:MAG: DUF3540 domain-containing protein [Comamonadaceae bacterium]